MKLDLNRKWFEDRSSAEDNCEVGAGSAPEESCAEQGLRVVEGEGLCPTCIRATTTEIRINSVADVP